MDVLCIHDALGDGAGSRAKYDLNSSKFPRDSEKGEMNVAWQCRKREDRDTLEEVARVPRGEVRERPAEKTGWSDCRPVGPHPNQFHLNQLHVEPLSHLSQHIL